MLAGSYDSIMIPVLSRFKLVSGRLRGLRLIHTHPKGDKLDHDDMADLALLRLDSVTACTMNNKGYPLFLDTAYILPPENDASQSEFGYLEDSDPYNQKTDYPLFIEALDDEIQRKTKQMHISKDGEYAVLTGVFKSKEECDINLDELEELVRSAGVNIIARVPQVKRNPSKICGRTGKT